MSLHFGLHKLRIEPRNFGQDANRPDHVFGVLADDRDGERAAVLDERRPSRSKITPRGARSGDRALMVVLRELFELGVLDNLEVPEAERERGKNEAERHLKHHRSNRDAASIFDRWREIVNQPYIRCVSLSPVSD